MADIFREVDEELKHEQYARLWAKYGNYIYLAVFLIVTAVAAHEGWSYYKTQRREAESGRFQEAVAMALGDDKTGAIATLAGLADDAATGYQVLARLREAALRIELGDRAGAIDAYETLAEDGRAAAIYRDLAVVLLVLHQMADGDAAVLEQRLQPITAPGNAWRYSALELAAALAERQGQRARAVELLKQLADDLDVPDGIRARAAETLKALGA